MMLDSNLIIYAARPEYPGLRRLIAARSPAVSAVSVVEVWATTSSRRPIGRISRRSSRRRRCCR